MFKLSAFHRIKRHNSLKIGDGLVLVIGMVFIIFLFKSQWQNGPASKVQVRLADQVIGTYSLNQQRDISVQGPLGESLIRIGQGQARFVRSPCQNQYCVHQHWLTRAGQVAICLPNHVSLALLGEKKMYDSLNY